MRGKEQPGSSGLDRLTAAERDILVLLGQGHTAKSIASLRGLSVGAVNERLRAARRKTGAASSRELSRLILAQKNGDEFFGLGAAAPAVVNSPHPPRAAPRGPLLTGRWRFLMITAVLAAAALLGQQTTTPPTVWSDGLAAEIMTHQPATPDMKALHTEVSQGPRDAGWSSRTETLLAQRYGEIEGFARDVPTASFRCSASLCEAAGIVRSDISSHELTELMIRLQGLGAPTPPQGLSIVIHSFSTADDRPPAFIAYWRRS